MTVPVFYSISDDFTKYAGLALKTGMKKIKRTWVEELLEEANLV